MAQLIKDWNELSKVPENDIYYLEIYPDKCYGYIRSKSVDEFRHYLSTHTFYGRTYKYSTCVLQECGFDVQLENWDGDTEEVNYRDQWLFRGKCNLCRRKDYCHTPCKARKEREKEEAETRTWKFTSGTDYSRKFDISQRKELADVKVKDLIELLQTLPPDAKMHFCGSPIGYLHVSKDRYTCSLDYEDLNAEYGEN